MAEWKKARGLLGPLKPLLGTWVAEPMPGAHGPDAMRCVRAFRSFGERWVELDARWTMGERGTYREIALFGAMADGTLGFFSFTNDGKRSEGRLADASDIHAQALAFAAQMPAGLARMTYWPLDDGPGFNFAVESKVKAGWNRFVHHVYRPREA